MDAARAYRQRHGGAFDDTAGAAVDDDGGGGSMMLMMGARAGAEALPWTCDAAVRAALGAAAATCVELVSDGGPLTAEHPRLLPSLHQVK